MHMLSMAQVDEWMAFASKKHRPLANAMPRTHDAWGITVVKAFLLCTVQTRDIRGAART